MDPISATGLALGIASLGLQVYTGCIQGIQLVITAANFPEDCKFLNLRLRMEQQRLFAWSEACGLLDLDAKNSEKVLESNTFVLHRTTVLDLLVQVQCLFAEFQEHQRRNRNLRTDTPGKQQQQQQQKQGDVLERPEADAAAANFPLPERRRNFIKKAMASLRAGSKETVLRLRWVSFDKAAFETLLARFSLLNDSMTGILDARMQVEIHHTVQDTNRGVLQLHHRIADLSRLVMALNMRLESSGEGAGLVTGAPSAAAVPQTPLSVAHKAANTAGLQTLSQLAKFKAFNESIEASSSDRRASAAGPWDEATAMLLGLAKPTDEQGADPLLLDRARIRLDPASEESDAPRCEAMLVQPGGVRKRVWVEWKDYDRPRPGDAAPPREVIRERVRKLAALLHHQPKPEAFRTPHCLGYFDKAERRPREVQKHEVADEDDDEDKSEDDDHDDDEEDDILDLRLGLVFERPEDDDLDPSLPPVSLRELLLDPTKDDDDRDSQQHTPTTTMPSVTDRVRLAHAVSSCLLYLHAVDWLHKGLRSDNVLFFRDRHGKVDFGRPVLSGFDFSRPARPDEMTEEPAGAEHDLYRHPRAQSTSTSASLTAAAAAWSWSGGSQSGSKSTLAPPTPTDGHRERFRKAFDVYSLGVLLVEVAHWRPVDAVLGIDFARGGSRGPRAAAAALRVRESLLAGPRLAALGARMGCVYEEATRRCLMAGGNDEAEEESVFYEDVVKRLGEVRV